MLDVSKVRTAVYRTLTFFCKVLDEHVRLCNGLLLALSALRNSATLVDASKIDNCERARAVEELGYSPQDIALLCRLAFREAVGREPNSRECMLLMLSPQHLPAMYKTCLTPLNTLIRWVPRTVSFYILNYCVNVYKIANTRLVFLHMPVLRLKPTPRTLDVLPLASLLERYNMRLVVVDLRENPHLRRYISSFVGGRVRGRLVIGVDMERTCIEEIEKVVGWLAYLSHFEIFYACASRLVRARRRPLY